MRRMWLVSVCMPGALLVAGGTPSEVRAQAADTLLVREALVIAGGDWYTGAGSIDPIESRIVTGRWSPPADGDPVAFPDTVHTWRHVEAAGPSVTTTVVQETEEPTSFFGRVVDRMLIPRALERDLRRTLDNLADMFSMGIPE